MHVPRAVPLRWDCSWTSLLWLCHAVPLCAVLVLHWPNSEQAAARASGPRGQISFAQGGDRQVWNFLRCGARRCPGHFVGNSP